VLDDERIEIAKSSLADMIGCADFTGKTFLDIGSGSGLFSLAARMLGATVFSFDYDEKSVNCTKELKRRYFDNDDKWTVCEGNVLDNDWLSTLGEWDIVYSWGVLHHTGAMWEALANADKLVKQGGSLFIAIYNDQGGKSRRWLKVKKRYNKGGRLTKLLIVNSVRLRFACIDLAVGLLRFGNPFHVWKEKKKNRGMSRKYDLLDWVGGYPFEVATPEEIFDFYYKKGYTLTRLATCMGGYGCNQFVFSKRTKGE
ncbi:MAG: class I SAM-dependent methyltransferase, partial [Lachnospiraceae bacterium]|nr:class I SAM-dependent methyltransferase [Lachnospiraceae bacterium]